VCKGIKLKVDIKIVRKQIKQLYPNNELKSFIKTFQRSKKELIKWKPLQKKTNGYIDVIDFFSGCGGMSLGFSAIGQSKIFNLIGAVDINQKALDSYETNFKCKTLNKDIKELCNADGVKLIREEFNLPKTKIRPLVIIGCAPCQGFSAHRKKNWDNDDERNTLIGAFADTAIKLNPEFIVMENVPEILGEKYWEHYDEARRILESNDYNVKQAIYNSASFGVPQARYRAIIIASKMDFEFPLPILEKKQFRTVRDAISDLPKVTAGEVAHNDKFHKSAKHKASTIETISQVPKDGGNRPSGIGPKCLDKVNGFSDVYGRLYWDKPSVTLTQYSRNPASGRFTHPEQNRGLTIREAARIQSFPDSYEFQGSLDHCFKQIGESVPPLLSIAVATQILRAFANVSESDDYHIESITAPVKASFSSQLISQTISL
jgi:DNA (cytosine-5)-methyltransferase 1